MVPSDPDKPETGTLVAIFTEDRSEQLTLGNSDESGEYIGRISKKYIGQKLRFPVRHQGYVYDHEYLFVVQPWGIFNAVKMTLDSNYNGSLTKAERDFAKISLNEYLKADAKAQYAARNEVSKTRWFWLAVTIGLVTTLLTIGLPKWLGFLATVIALGIRAYLTNHSLGLKKKPIH
jgi:hypothetical protein